MTNTKMATDWTINTDIYDIVDSIKNLQKRYIEDEDETTLSLGVFGFITDTEAKKIQTATIMAGQLGNEMFPTRAILTKNILTHAAYHNIEDINAIPATMSVTLCIKESDIDANIVRTETPSGGIIESFTLDANNGIFVGDYEFHFDYDVKIIRQMVAGVYNYSAQYILNDANDNKIINRLSDVINPYLKQPFVLNIGGESYVGIQATLRQVTITEINDVLISDSIVENKTYQFDFENQLADFTVTIINDGEETVLTPYMYGQTSGTTEKYCWYLYISNNTIRVTFDSKSFIPGLNSQIYIKAYSTLGSAGNFNYLNIDETSEGLYVELASETYNYQNIIGYLVAVTDSENGSDRKSKEELQRLIPKAAMTRGSITTEKDLDNYFNLINTDTNRLVMRKKQDNQLTRIWYGYFLLKDSDNNIIPSNTIKLQLSTQDNTMIRSLDGRYVLPAGSIIRYDPISKIGKVIDDAATPDIYSKYYYNTGYYYYMTIYNMTFCLDPLYCASTLTLCNYDSYFIYDYVNQESLVQFIANRFHFNRNLLLDQDSYTFTFNIAQSINDDIFDLYDEEEIEVTDPDGTVHTEVITTQNIRVVMVIKESNVPYRWAECDLIKADKDNSIYYFSKDLITDNIIDDKNRLKITNLKEAGSDNIVDGYMDGTCDVDLYILIKTSYSSAVSDSPRKDLDSIAPGYDDYIVTNIYKAADGVRFYEDFTGITDSLVQMATESVDVGNVFFVDSVPVIGRQYIKDETSVKFFVNALNERKAYIDYCLELVENSMNIDFKFFNTYGPSLIYKLEDRETGIGSIDINMRFKVSIKDNSDPNVRKDIIDATKAYMENIYDIGDWHAPNLITELMNQFSDRVNFIEFVGFNEFDADDQHIYNIIDDDPSRVPEFLNVRNLFDLETMEYYPAIEIEFVT